MSKMLRAIITQALSADVPDIQISGLQIDSRAVKEGNVFVALKGLNHNGLDFIDDAIKKGAIAVLSEQPTTCNVPQIVIPNLVSHLGDMASRFFDAPSEKMNVIGVTGTNGKTSCTHYIAQAMQKAGHKSGVLGTLGSGIWPNLTPSRYTTPDVIACHGQLSDLLNQGADVVAMEVSSHGLDQGRVNGVNFDTAVFTNLSRDHLDYHVDMENYAAAKAKLFEWPSLKQAVINIDDPVGEQFALQNKGRYPIYTYSLLDKKLSGCEPILASRIHLNGRDMSAKIESPWGEGTLKANLLGKFNLSNLLAVLGVLCISGINFEDALGYLRDVKNVTGRMQAFGGGKLPLVVVDYAHTPDALEQALVALREHTRGKLWCVFGCGGNRDHGKRSIMGQVAERHSDQIVITSDNPREEDPQSIINDIKAGLLCDWAAEIELDRGSAIAHAIDCAQAGDVVLIAGKGHEDYQIVGEERLPFNDITQVETHILEKSQRLDD